MFFILRHFCDIYYGLHFIPEEKDDDDDGGLEEEEEVLIGNELFPRRVDGSTTRERFRGITALGGGATRP